MTNEEYCIQNKRRTEPDELDFEMYDEEEEDDESDNEADYSLDGSALASAESLYSQPSQDTG